ncbi:MAG: hypothetical protein FWC43_10290 [Planctomycetaceae bacterium]|nr:hypothetical protein [Planctomycetaceae bacterium]
MTAVYDHSDLQKAAMVVKAQNEEYLRKKVVGAEAPGGGDFPQLKLFTGE